MTTDSNEDGWKATRKKVLARDDHKCRFCGVSNEAHQDQYNRGLHAHHIIPSGDGGRDIPGNLITVCQSCHQTLEKTHAKAVAQMARREDYSTQLIEMKEIYIRYDQLLREYNTVLGEFVDKHPIFSKEVAAHCEGQDVRVNRLEKVTDRFGGPKNINSELRFVTAFGYKEGIEEVVMSIDGHTKIPQYEP